MALQSKPPTTSEPERQALPHRLWIPGLTVILSGFVFAPLHGFTQEIEPDLSFRIVTHEAFVKGLQWGTDIVSTYGPWGFLFRGFHPGTDLLLFVVNILLGAVFGLSLSAHLKPVGSWWLQGFLIAGILSLLAFGGSDSRYFAVMLLAILRFSDEERDPSRADRFLLLVAVGLVSLIKFSYFLLGMAMAALLLGRDIFSYRRRPTASIVLIGSMATFWLIAGQALTNVPRWIWWSAQMASGYSRGGVLLPRPGETGHILLAVGSAGLILLGVLLCLGRMSRTALAVRTAALSLSLWFLFKASFVRFDDSHSITAAASLGVLALMVLPLDVKRSSRMRGAALPIVFVVFSACAILAGFDSLQSRAVLAARLVQEPMTLPDLYRSHRAETRRRWPVPRVAGSVDSLHAGQAALIAERLHYQPRPVFQSYLAWNGALAELNARHFMGDSAPDYLRIEFLSVDEHYSLMEDGAAWLEIAARYQPSPLPMMLEKRGSPLQIRRRLLVEQTLDSGEEMMLPEGDLLWAEVRSRPTLAGRIYSLVIRGPVQTFELSTRNTPLASFRFFPAAEAGFLLSPIFHAPSFAAWLANAPAVPTGGSRPDSVIFRSEADQGVFRETFEVQIWEIELY